MPGDCRATGGSNAWADGIAGTALAVSRRSGPRRLRCRQGDACDHDVSDLETDPATVPLLIAEARQHPAAIITATRWKGGINFEGYDPLKLVLNKVFQGFFALLYRVRLTDLTFAYRIFPTDLVRSIRWEELKHPFLFETIVKPLRLGVDVVEVPSTWRVRTEGVSHNTFLTNFVYFRIGLKTLFMPPGKILKEAK